MNLLGVGAIVETVGKVIDDLHTSDKEKRELDLRELEIRQATDLAQMEVYKAEAQHMSLFVAGWRPAIGWIGAASMAYQFIAYPLLLWVLAGWFPDVKPPPMLDTDALWVVLTGMLGIAGMRSVEKVRGVARG